MRSQVVYDSFGNATSYRLDGREVTAEVYEAAHPSKLAEMFASGRAPCIRTTATIFAGQHSQPAMGDPDTDAMYREIAADAGVSVNGAVYNPTLASFPGDPRAWIRDEGDAMRLAEERNLTLSGAVTRQAIEVPPMPDVDVAPDIVYDKMLDLMDIDPAIRERVEVHGKAKEVYHEVKESLLPDLKPVPVEM